MERCASELFSVIFKTVGVEIEKIVFHKSI